MSAIVNFGGDDDIWLRGPLYCPPRKRSKLNPSPFFRGERKHHQEFPSLDSLPDECLYEILRRLPGNQERSNSACVSKRWLTLLSSIQASELMLKGDEAARVSKKQLPDLNFMHVEDTEVEIDRTGCITRCLNDREVTDVRLAAIAVGTAGHGGLGKLTIRGSHRTRGLTNVGLSAVARCCPSLKSLSMWKVPFVGDEGLYELASGCSMLEKLDLLGCPLITDKGLVAIAEKCPNLTSLTIDSCAKIGNEGLQAIGRMCPKLEAVSIKDCPLVGDAGISGMMSSAGSSLSKLLLQNLNVSDLALTCVGHYGKAITKLYLIGLQNVAERGFWCMGNAKGLQELKHIIIASCNGVTDAGLQAVAKGCPILKQLCLRKCCYLSDAGLKAFFESALELERLQLDECYRVTLVGVLAGLVSNTKLKSLVLVKCLGIKDFGSSPNALPLCKSLRSLTIRDCPGFTSNSLAVVGKICPSLINLDLSGLVDITDAGFLALIENSDEGLVKVSIKGCANLTDSGISTLVNKHGLTLKTLNLDGCNKLTDRILLSISEHCIQLEELEMSKADITDYGVALVASARHLNIRMLSLSGCSKVSCRSLPLIANMGAHLAGLNIQHCDLINSKAIASLEEKMWWCDILS